MIRVECDLCKRTISDGRFVMHIDKVVLGQELTFNPATESVGMVFDVCSRCEKKLIMGVFQEAPEVTP